MSEDKKIYDFMDNIITMCESQFPRNCSNCNKKFNNFREFIEKTTIVGASPSSMYEDFKEDPIGLLSFVNCSCQSTLILKCEDLSGEMHAMFNETLINQSKSENCEPEILLSKLREKIRNLVLSQEKIKLS